MPATTAACLRSCQAIPAWVGSPCATAGRFRLPATVGSKVAGSGLAASGGKIGFNLEIKNKYVKLDKNAQQPLG